MDGHLSSFPTSTIKMTLCTSSIQIICKDMRAQSSSRAWMDKWIGGGGFLLLRTMELVNRDEFVCYANYTTRDLAHPYFIHRTAIHQQQRRAEVGRELEVLDPALDQLKVFSLRCTATTHSGSPRRPLTSFKLGWAELRRRLVFPHLPQPGLTGADFGSGPGRPCLTTEGPSGALGPAGQLPRTAGAPCRLQYGPPCTQQLDQSE